MNNKGTRGLVWEL